MKTTRKLLALLVLAMLCVAFAIGASAETDGDWTYTIANQQATITGYSGMEKNVTVPATLGGNAVTAIGENVFAANETLETIAFPDSLKTIGYGAFQDCTALKSLTIPEKVEVIEGRAFANCTHLSEITINAIRLQNFTPEPLGGAVFYNAGKETEGITVIFGDTATYVPSHFGAGDSEHDPKIKYVVLGNGVTEIGNNAFGFCVDLTQITWGTSLKRIGANAFNSCVSLKEGDLPEGITEIGASAFEACIGFTRITIPESVTKIGCFAFSDCRKVTEIVINAKNLEDLSNFGVGTTGSSAFRNVGFDTDGTTVVFGDEVTRIPANLFACDGGDQVEPNNGYAKINKVVVGNNVREIGQYAFLRCKELKEITIPRSVLHIHHSILIGCEQVTIYGYRGTAAETFAKQQGINFAALSGGVADYPFTDVPSDKYYYDAILWAYKNDIAAGKSATTFAPEDACKRGEVVAFLWRAFGRQEPKTSNSPFVDVAEDAYYYKAVLWAYENGIVYGKDNTHFAPEDTVTRGQFVAFLYRAEGAPVYTIRNNFVDISLKDYYFDAVHWAYDNHVVYGISADKFAPNDPCTRGQVAAFLYRDMG